jgi:hypothetical protein
MASTTNRNGETAVSRYSAIAKKSSETNPARSTSANGRIATAMTTTGIQPAVRRARVIG